MVQKIVNWDENLSWDWFKNVDLVGGRPFDTQRYVGEQILIDSVNNDYFNGMDISKLFRTEDRFDRPSLLEAFEGDNGFIYILTHGGGDSIDTENDWSRVRVDDLMALPSNLRVPIVVSIACMDGAFDTGLYPNTLYGYTQNTSFGEAVLLSKAAGIAYIGGSRVNYGIPDSYLDKGYLNIIKEPYMAGMLTYLFEAYHNGRETLGAMTREAIGSFVEENDFSSDITNSITLFEFVLLGDPALKLPEQEPRPSYQQPNSTALDPLGYKDTIDYISGKSEMPYYPTGKNITIHIETDPPRISIKLIDANADQVVEKITSATIENAIEYTFTSSDEATIYLIRAEADDGKEGWLYLVTTPAEFTGNFTDYGLDTDGDGLYDYLVVEAEVNVTKAGEYELEGDICYWNGEYWEWFDYAWNSTYLDVGVRNISLEFEGWKIYNLGYNGTFLVKMEMYDAMDSAEYETGYYTYDQFPAPVPDEYEPDDDYTLANWIEMGTKQHHDFHVAGDLDWVRFNATAGMAYVIETSDLGPGCDTYLYLYSTDGITEIESDDDGGDGFGSLIEWECTTDGVYYVMVRHYYEEAIGLSTFYDLSIMVRV